MTTWSGWTPTGVIRSGIISWPIIIISLIPWVSSLICFPARWTAHPVGDYTSTSSARRPFAFIPSTTPASLFIAARSEPSTAARWWWWSSTIYWPYWSTPLPFVIVSSYITFDITSINCLLSPFTLNQIFDIMFSENVCFEIPSQRKWFLEKAIKLSNSL